MALPVRPDQIEDIYELSPMQQGMLFHTLRDGETAAYIEQFSCRLQGALNVPAFEAAWRGLISRHPALRTCFFWEDVEKPVQVVLRQVMTPLTIVEWLRLPEAESQTRFDALLASDRGRGFDLGHAPLIRVRLARTSPDACWLAFTHSHLLLDGWSMPMIFDELFMLYEAAVDGRAAHLPARPPYRDFIAWLRKQDFTGAQRFWRGRLGGFPGPTPLPLGVVRGPRRVVFTERQSLVSRGALDAWCRERRLAPNTLVQAAWALTLARLTGRDDVVFGMTVSGRPPDLAGVESMVGLFINTLPVRVTLRPATQAGAWLEDLQRALADLRQFEHTPLARIQEWVPEVSPLFDTLLVFENYPSRVGEGTAARTLRVDSARVFERTNYPVTLVVAPGERLTVRLIVDETRIPAASAEQILRYFDRAIEAIVDGVAGAVGNLSLVPRVEHDHVQAALGRTTSLPQDERFVVERIEAQAAVAPEAAAVVAIDGRVLAYGDLNRRANRLARYLRAAGVVRESRVGICFDRTPDEIVAELAVLKAGGAYVPFDPVHPPARWHEQAADAGVTSVLTGRAFGALWAGAGPRVVEVDRAEQAIAACDAANLDLACNSQGLAYVIYTSGSTGRSKGVAVTHGGLRNLTAWHLAAFGTTPGDRQPHLASPAFDASVWETWPCLAAGATLYLCGADLIRDPEALRAWMVDQRITSAFAPTPLAETLIGLAWPADTALRVLLTGGDRLHAFPPSGLPFRLVNNYGPTEHTVVATSGPVPVRTGSDEAAPSIGGAIARTSAYVVDPLLALVPGGAEGELCVGGPSLARGYWNAPDMTAGRFVPDPFSAEPGARMYRTGDRVRALPDGGFAFVGRTDHQVKLRGFRIELGEIEHRLREQPGVREAAVALRADRPGQEHLVAYVVRDPAVPPSHLRDTLARSLPDYMVPRVWVDLERLPLTVQGKIDRAALSGEGHAIENAVATPADPIEAVLATIWEDVLQTRGAGSHDDFFALGGHSLSAMRVLSRIRATWPIQLPLAALFEHTTLSALAAQIRALLRSSTGMSAPPIGRRAGVGPAPLSFSQERLWFLEQLPKAANPYHIALAFRIDGAVDDRMLGAALTRIVDRHQALRTTFHVVDGRPVQQIEPAGPVTIDVRPLESADDATVDRLMAAAAARPFDLERGPLVRAVLMRGPSRHHLLFVVHHIAADGWSMAVIARELTELSRALTFGDTPRLPALPVQYADVAVWQREWLDRSGSMLLEYWRGTLDGVPPLELPADRPRAPVQTHRGGMHTFSLPRDVSSALDLLRRREQATMFMMLVSAFAALLHRYTGQDDFAIGSPISGRTSPGTEDLVGCFVNTIVLRMRPSGAGSFRDLLTATRRSALEAYAHQDVPFEQLVQALNPDRDLGRAPIFQTMFVWQNAPVAAVDVGGARWQPYPVDSGAAQFDLMLTMAESDNAVAGIFEYSSDLFDAGTIERLAAHFNHLLAAIAREPDRAIGDLPIIDAGERRLLTVTWNETVAAYPDGERLQDLLEAQVGRTPDAIAVSFERDHLTYRQLDRRAGQLAVDLRARGVGPDTVVAVCLERSIEMVVALCGVLKAGGAYLPLGTDYPRDRLAYMIQDARVPVVVTSAALAARVPASGADVIALDVASDPRPLAGAAESPTTTPDHLAYVIYTSGSTGRPKGVMITHRAIVNRLRWIQDAYRLTDADVVLQKTPYTFDVSVWEFFWPLMTGGRLVVAKPGGHQDAGYLAEIIAGEGVTIVHFVPSMLDVFLDHESAGTCRSLRQVFASGEALPADLQRRFFATLEGRLDNLYGPTEAAVDVTFWSCEPASSWATVPIGRPIANARTYVVDPRGGLAPIGVAGELFLGGVGLARGYLARPDLTAARFVPDAFSGEEGSRLYRTGDRVRQGPDGRIEFLGRLDDQVKIRGFRIELGEIEASLTRHPAVRQAVVVTRTHGTDRRLVAYVVPVGGSIVDPADLRRHLLQLLPDYMVPPVYVSLDEWPLTSSGKIDRKALPAAPDPSDAQGLQPAETPVEEAVAALWRELLGHERIGRDSHFFELGGHSLLVTRLLSRVQEIFRVSLPMLSVFDAPTVSRFAETLTAAEAVAGQTDQIARTWLMVRSLSSEDRDRLLSGAQ